MISDKTASERSKHTILLVDDEEMITDAIGTLLEKVGYRVICAGGGMEAVRVVEQSEEDIHLVILDMLMPDMDGQKTFHRIKKIQPKLPVLMASGYNHHDQLRDIMQNGCNGFIQKPYSLSQLHPTIQNILTECRETSEDGPDR